MRDTRGWLAAWVTRDLYVAPTAFALEAEQNIAREQLAQSSDFVSGLDI